MSIRENLTTPKHGPLGLQSQKEIAFQAINIYQSPLCTRYCARSWEYNAEYNREVPGLGGAYILKLNSKPGINAHTYSLSSQEAEVGGTL